MNLNKFIWYTISILIELQDPETLSDVLELLHINADLILLFFIFLFGFKLEFVKLRMNCTCSLA